jgi:hypothetical protein
MDDLWQRLAAGPIPVEDLPEELDLTVLEADLQRLWEATQRGDAAGRRVEYAGTLVLDRDGAVRMIHERAGTAEGVTPELRVEPGQTLLGVLHTHVPLPWEPNFGLSFGPEDIASIINRGYALSVVRSGHLVCALVRTKATAEQVDASAIESRFQALLLKWRAPGVSLPYLILGASLELAQGYGLGAYMGMWGIRLERV